MQEDFVFRIKCERHRALRGTMSYFQLQHTASVMILAQS